MARVGVYGQISELNDHLYLSGSQVLKPEKLRQKRISYIVNATTEEPNGYIQGIEYMKVRVEDAPWSPLDSYFDAVADKIKQNKDKGHKTLVHCVAGVSRSVSLCMVYLVKYGNMTLRQAYQHIKCIRPIIRPNCGFWKQMIDYERKLTGQTSVKMVPTGLIVDGDDKAPDVYVNEIRNRQKAAEIRNTKEADAIRKQFLAQRSTSVGARRQTSPITGFTYSTPSQTVSSSSSYRPNRRFSSARYSTTTTQPSLSAHLTSALVFPVRSPLRVSSYTPSKKAYKRENLFSTLYNSTHELFYPVM